MALSTQPGSRSCSPPRPSPARSHLGSPLSQAHTPPRPTSPSPPTWKPGVSAGLSSATAACFGPGSPHVESVAAPIGGARRSLFSPTDAVNMFGPGSVPRSCPGLGCPSRRAASGKENSKAYDNAITASTKEDFRGKFRNVLGCEGAAPGTSTQHFLNASAKYSRTDRPCGQSRHVTAPVAQVGSSRPCAPNRSHTPICSPSPRTRTGSVTSDGTHSTLPSHAKLAAACAPSGAQHAGRAEGAPAAVSEGPRMFNAPMTPPRPSCRTSDEAEPSTLALDSPISALRQPASLLAGAPQQLIRPPPAESETTPDKARRLAQLLELPGGIAALTNVEDLPEGRTLDVWLRFASR